MDPMIEKLLKRAVDTVYPNYDFLLKKLAEDKKLRIYLGVDPTGEMHIGHTVPLRKLRHFQDLGHQVILLIGSFTAQIGDPTDKSQTRKQLTKEQVLENAKKYAKYAAKILDFEGDNPPEVVYNADWLEKLTFKEVVELAANYTVQQMLERDMFAKRMREGLPISLHEFLYPLMQGYDSVALGVDFEVGGTDQTFNMLAGRRLIERYRGVEKGVIAAKLLTDNNGKKMGKTEGNAIFLDLSPEDMYGGVMSLDDGFLENMFELCTDVPMGEIREMAKRILEGANPMVYKKRLALEITSVFHGSEQAKNAQLAFEQTVQGGALPAEIAEYHVSSENVLLRDLLVNSGLCSSNAEAKRLIEEQAVSMYVNDVVSRLADPKALIAPVDGTVLKVGKRRFLKLRVV